MDDENTKAPDHTDETRPTQRSAPIAPQPAAVPFERTRAVSRVWSLRTAAAVAITALALGGAGGAAFTAASDSGSAGGSGGDTSGETHSQPPGQPSGQPPGQSPVTNPSEDRDT